MSKVARLTLSGLVASSLVFTTLPAQAVDWTASISDVMNLVFCLVGAGDCEGLEPGADQVDITVDNDQAYDAGFVEGALEAGCTLTKCNDMMSDVCGAPFVAPGDCPGDSAQTCDGLTCLTQVHCLSAPAPMSYLWDAVGVPQTVSIECDGELTVHNFCSDPSGGGSGTAPCDPTIDNQASYDDGFADGVASVDITSNDEQVAAEAAAAAAPDCAFGSELWNGEACICADGYAPGGDGLCADIDECAGVDCGPAGLCEHAIGETIDGLYDCVPNEEACGEHAHIENLGADSASGMDCVCDAGYTVEAGTCVDMDECAGVDCGPGSACTHAVGETTPGQYTCNCLMLTVENPGYAGGGVNTPCTEVNACNGFSYQGVAYGGCEDFFYGLWVTGNVPGDWPGQMPNIHGGTTGCYDYGPGHWECSLEYCLFELPFFTGCAQTGALMMTWNLPAAVAVPSVW